MKAMQKEEKFQFKQVTSTEFGSVSKQKLNNLQKALDKSTKNLTIALYDLAQEAKLQSFRVSSSPLFSRVYDSLLNNVIIHQEKLNIQISNYLELRDGGDLDEKTIEATEEGITKFKEDINNFNSKSMGPIIQVINATCDLAFSPPSHLGNTSS